MATWLSPRLWRVLADEATPGRQRLAAASALASFDRRLGSWEPVAGPVVRELITMIPCSRGIGSTPFGRSGCT